MAVIKVIEGPGEGDSLLLSEKNSLGRARECDLRVKAAEASRNHAQIVQRGADYFVIDLNSSNGTYLNGVKISEAKIKDGDKITISGVTLQFSDDKSLTSSAVLEELPPEAKAQPKAKPEQEHRAEADGLFPEDFRRKAFVRSDVVSETYVATDTKMNRLVEVGLVSAQYCKNTDEVIKRLKSASQFTHPALTHIYDVGTIAGQVWYSHEQVSRDMQKVSGKLSHREVAEIGAQVAEALAVAHSMALVHGSIMPEKILRADNGRVKIVGLGLPVPHTSDTSVDPMEKMKSLTYMAPEQFAGSEPNALSDIYSLGGVLYKMLTGQPPINAENPVDPAEKEKAQGKLSGPAKKVAQIIEKMMASTPGDRYKSMAEVQKELEPFAGVAVTTSKEAPTSEPAVQTADKKGLGAAGILIFIMGAIIVLMAFIIGMTNGEWFIKQSNPPPQQQPQQPGQ